MREIVFSDNFVSSVKNLDRVIAVKINNGLALLQKNAFHPKLHTKPLRGKLTGFYSFRVGRDYRVIFKFLQNKNIFLISAEHRSKVYK